MILLVTMILLSIGVGYAAAKRYNRTGLGWFLFAIVFSPLIAGVFLIALGYNNKPAHVLVSDRTATVVGASLVGILLAIVVGTFLVGVYT